MKYVRALVEFLMGIFLGIPILLCLACIGVIRVFMYPPHTETMPESWKTSRGELLEGEFVQLFEEPEKCIGKQIVEQKCKWPDCLCMHFNACESPQHHEFH